MTRDDGSSCSGESDEESQSAGEVRASGKGLAAPTEGVAATHLQSARRSVLARRRLEQVRLERRQTEARARLEEREAEWWAKHGQARARAQAAKGARRKERTVVTVIAKAQGQALLAASETAQAEAVTMAPVFGQGGAVGGVIWRFGGQGGAASAPVFGQDGAVGGVPWRFGG